MEQTEWQRKGELGRTAEGQDVLSVLCWGRCNTCSDGPPPQLLFGDSTAEGTVDHHVGDKEEGSKVKTFYQNTERNQVRWSMAVIPPTREAEAEGPQIQVPPGQLLSKVLFPNKKGLKMQFSGRTPVG